MGEIVSTCDLNVFDVMCDSSQCDWDVRNESICDKNQRAKFYPLEASAARDKVARSVPGLVIVSIFLYTTLYYCYVELIFLNCLLQRHQSQFYLRINPNHSNTTTDNCQLRN